MANAATEAGRRAAYYRAVEQFLAWIERPGYQDLENIEPTNRSSEASWSSLHCHRRLIFELDNKFSRSSSCLLNGTVVEYRVQRQCS